MGVNRNGLRHCLDGFFGWSQLMGVSRNVFFLMFCWMVWWMDLDDVVWPGWFGLDGCKK